VPVIYLYVCIYGESDLHLLVHIVIFSKSDVQLAVISVSKFDVQLAVISVSKFDVQLANLQLLVHTNMYLV
jgi:hypothetical protein